MDFKRGIHYPLLLSSFLSSRSPPISYSVLPISLRNSARKIHLWNLGGHCKHPQRGLGESPSEVEFVEFCLNIRLKHQFRVEADSMSLQKISWPYVSCCSLKSKKSTGVSPSASFNTPLAAVKWFNFAVIFDSTLFIFTGDIRRSRSNFID